MQQATTEEAGCLAEQSRSFRLRKAPFPTADLLQSNSDEGLKIFEKYMTLRGKGKLLEVGMLVMANSLSAGRQGVRVHCWNWNVKNQAECSLYGAYPLDSLAICSPQRHCRVIKNMQEQAQWWPPLKMALEDLSAEGRSFDLELRRMLSAKAGVEVLKRKAEVCYSLCTIAPSNKTCLSLWLQRYVGRDGCLPLVLSLGDTNNTIHIFVNNTDTIWQYPSGPCKDSV